MLLMNRTEQQLKESLQLSLAKRHSIEQITVNDLIKIAGVGKSTFYRHYRDKYDLLNSIVIDISQHTFLLSEHDYFDQMYEGLNQLKQNRVLFQNALKYHGQNSITRALQLGAQNYLYRLILSQHSATFTDQYKFAIKFYCYGMVGIMKEWLLSGCDRNLNQLTKLIVDQMPAGLHKIIFDNGTNS